MTDETDANRSMLDKIERLNSEIEKADRRAAEQEQVIADLERDLATAKRSLLNRGMPALERVKTFEEHGSIAIGVDWKGHTVIWKTHTPTEVMFVEPADLADLRRAVASSQPSGLGWPTKASAESASMVGIAYALNDGTYAAAVSARGYPPDEVILPSGRRVNVQLSKRYPSAWCIVEVAENGATASAPDKGDQRLEQVTPTGVAMRFLAKAQVLLVEDKVGEASCAVDTYLRLLGRTAP